MSFTRNEFITIWKDQKNPIEAISKLKTYLQLIRENINNAVKKIWTNDDVEASMTRLNSCEDEITQIYLKCLIPIIADFPKTHTTDMTNSVGSALANYMPTCYDLFKTCINIFPSEHVRINFLVDSLQIIYLSDCLDKCDLIYYEVARWILKNYVDNYDLTKKFLQIPRFSKINSAGEAFFFTTIDPEQFLENNLGYWLIDPEHIIFVIERFIKYYPESLVKKLFSQKVDGIIYSFLKFSNISINALIYFNELLDKIDNQALERYLLNHKDYFAELLSKLLAPKPEKTGYENMIVPQLLKLGTTLDGFWDWSLLLKAMARICNCHNLWTPIKYTADLLNEMSDKFIKTDSIQGLPTKAIKGNPKTFIKSFNPAKKLSLKEIAYLISELPNNISQVDNFAPIAEFAIQQKNSALLVAVCQCYVTWHLISPSGANIFLSMRHEDGTKLNFETWIEWQL